MATKRKKPPSTAPRRVPLQARSQRRREQILDATAALLASRGLDAVTTNAIAARARTSIGSVYEFFPNKEAVLHALTGRYLERLQARTEAVLAEAPPGPWRELTERWIDALAAFYRTEPGYRELWFGAQLSGAQLSTGVAWGDEFSARVEAILSPLTPALAPAERRVVARSTLYIASTLLALATQQDEQQGALYVEEAKKAVCRYLAPSIEPAGRPGESA
ncbi:TetR/AcrR family transcriptional regulator [Sorangium sp. So ce887]|uniref:TetR/AcrR family transcriptional regulator n=1 Tax=Sorangium sp. So ce887 TaxID=3133324 RepID=UPI003F60160A